MIVYLQISVAMEVMLIEEMSEIILLLPPLDTGSYSVAQGRLYML